MSPKQAARVILRRKAGKDYKQIARSERLAPLEVKTFLKDNARDVRKALARKRFEAVPVPKAEPLSAWDAWLAGDGTKGPAFRSHQNPKANWTFPDRTKQPGYWERVAREIQLYRQESFERLTFEDG